MGRTGEQLVTLVVRCPDGFGPKAMQAAFELWLRRCNCEVIYAAVRPAPRGK